MTTTPTFTLRDGAAMPAVGFGVYQIPAAETETAVTAALEAGYRHLDTAAAYENEEAVGRAIAASGLPRDELFVTTKLWVQDAGEAPSRAAAGRSLERLGLDHVDLLLIHQPFGDYYGTWRTLQELQREGLVRSIGVSNFAPDRLMDLIDHNEVVPAVNQIEAHPFHQRVADLALLEQHQVRAVAWGPLGQGRGDLFTHPVLTRIAEAHGASVAQVVLAWLLQRGIAVLPKSVHPERMQENLAATELTLAADEMDAIAALDTGVSTAFDHRDPASVHALGTTRFAV
ncbi:aldo/keto reductase [Brachybacterium squillarum]|uniref:aldo/keto reductase n=1 Tax=Brachybacterium squillarum TaxID=661979 RepID=UPI002221B578|nr:aldo/keto reductase [Brachybacterium squillarum]MCW1804069.1 aldo/keto reductase [Brachybacterium squillarum]